MSITFSSCFYIIKSKFDKATYIQWMNNLICIVNNFNLVIYTDENSCKYINTGGNPKIKIIIKPIEQFYHYKYKNFWIKNHEKNDSLNNKSQWNSCWELNMLWSEKIWFVKETIERNYFELETEFYGWCDIGYFRNNHSDINTSFLSNWSHPSIINRFQKDKICYACVNNNDQYLNELYNSINDKTIEGLPKQPIAPYINTVAGGFFIIHKEKINWWSQLYDEKLQLYFKNNYLVKDDQIILADCVFSNFENFMLHRENNPRFDNWFMFQRILNSIEKEY